MRVLGIDPGLSGGYALLGGDSPPLVEAFPMAGGRIDLAALANDWRGLAPAVAVLEAVHAMPKQGVSSTFTFGEGYGAVKGILAALGVRLELVTPQAWKKLVLAGTPKDKAAAVEWARRAYPGLTLIRPGCRIPHDGMADALGIAEYGRRSFGERRP